MRQYKITGRIFSEEPHYYPWDRFHEFPVYDQVGEEVWAIHAGTLADAKRWFKNNHPDMVQGGSIIRIDSDAPEFCMFAVPSEEYGTGNFETQENRTAWALRTMGE